MSTSFPDHYSRIAPHYAAGRPHYPPALFAYLAQQCAVRQIAWDVGTGSGQAAIGLADFFAQVIATDAAQAQLDCATLHPRIDYRCVRAEASGLPAHSVDLVTVAQALHWFDLPAFYAEVKRVLREGGRIAVWTYGVFEVDDAAVNARLQDFYWSRIGPYWPAERHHVHTAYRELPFPFAPIDTPRFAMQAEWSLGQLITYVRSWSATARCVAATGADPAAELEAVLAADWGAARTVRWPLNLQLGVQLGAV